MKFTYDTNNNVETITTNNSVLACNSNSCIYLFLNYENISKKLKKYSLHKVKSDIMNIEGVYIWKETKLRLAKCVKS